MKEKYLTLRGSVLGMFHGIEGGVKAGQTLVIDEHLGLREQADQYVSTGLANYGSEVTGRAYEPDEAAVELGRKLAQKQKQQWQEQHPELAPRPGSEPIGPRYRRPPVKEWSA